MSHFLDIRTDAGDDWHFHANRAIDGRVWFHVRAGPSTFSLFLTADQAEALAGIVKAARDDDGRAAEKLAEARLGLA